jgi:hypothetical protein
MTGTNTTDAGPHDSKAANKLDPRVDSDMGKPREIDLSSQANYRDILTQALLKTTGPRNQA